jgi:hypothetical protein
MTAGAVLRIAGLTSLGLCFGERPGFRRGLRQGVRQPATGGKSHHGSGRGGQMESFAAIHSLHPC